jgi:hypothetical protein
LRFGAPVEPTGSTNVRRTQNAFVNEVRKTDAPKLDGKMKAGDAKADFFQLVAILTPRASRSQWRP